MAEPNEHRGTTLDDFLKEEGIFDDAQEVALREVVTWQLQQAMAERKITKKKLAELMKTSRPQVDRLLDPKGPAIQLDTLQRAAAAVGRRVALTLEPA